MFVREKTVNGYNYLYLVESVRENGRTKQRIIRNLGRKEAVLASGALDRLIASIGRFAERSLVLRAIEEGDARFEVRRIGAPLLFGRLWEETGCLAAVSELVVGRGFCFEVERAVFVAVLHRLMVSGSDRSCVHWMTDLDRLQSGVIEKDNKRNTIRTPVSGDVGTVFRAAGVALPPNIAETPSR